MPALVSARIAMPAVVSPTQRRATSASDTKKRCRSRNHQPWAAVSFRIAPSERSAVGCGSIGLFLVEEKDTIAKLNRNDEQHEGPNFILLAMGPSCFSDSTVKYGPPFRELDGHLAFAQDELCRVGPALAYCGFP